MPAAARITACNSASEVMYISDPEHMVPMEILRGGLPADANWAIGIWMAQKFFKLSATASMFVAPAACSTNAGNRRASKYS